jgi:hypothetical protein
MRIKGFPRLPVFPILILCTGAALDASAQMAPLRLAKSTKAILVSESLIGRGQSITSLVQSKDLVLKATAKPAITGASPLKAGLNSIVTIKGSHFDKSTSVSFGGASAIEVVVVSDTVLKARVGLAVTGDVIVTNADASSDAYNGFVYVKPPTITSVTHKQQQGGSDITIIGTNFDGECSISINGEDPILAFPLSTTQLYLPMKDAVIVSRLAIFTAGGEVDYPSDGGTPPSAAANADINFPDFGNGLTMIPTPQFDYGRLSQNGKTSFNVRLWGNGLGTDSSLQKVGAKFLSPELSSFGLRVEEDVTLNKNDGSSWIFAMECNVLVKKVSYFDEKAGTSTNFTPGVIHPRLGLIKTFQHNNGFVSLYGNFPAVVGSNQQFTSFFHTGAKNVFCYPEADFGYLLPVSGNGNQSLKFQLSIVDNNGEAQFMSASSDTFLYYFKFGFVSSF